MYGLYNVHIVRTFKRIVYIIYTPSPAAQQVLAGVELAGRYILRRYQGGAQEHGVEALVTAPW